MLNEALIPNTTPDDDRLAIELAKQLASRSNRLTTIQNCLNSDSPCRGDLCILGPNQRTECLAIFDRQTFAGHPLDMETVLREIETENNTNFRLTAGHTQLE
ncbi:hypothetical protein M1116_00130 [Patescibacteria group bacterium]|nr:hypothetical protein [Patescibacteria group bacterium]